jgi:CHAT domain-containing protein
VFAGLKHPLPLFVCLASALLCADELDMRNRADIEREATPAGDIRSRVDAALASRAPGTVDYAESLLVRAHLARTLGGNALDDFTAARTICRTRHHPCEIESLRWLTRLAAARPDLPLARRLAAEYREVVDSHHGPNHAETTLAAVETAALELNSNAIRALAELEALLPVMRQRWGRDHTNVAHAASQAGGAARYAQMHDQALQYYAEAIRIYQAAFGPEHSTLIPLNFNLGLTHKSAGDYKAAGPLLERAATLANKRYGPVHPTTLAARTNYAIFVGETGDQAQARAILEEILAAQEKALGLDHPNIATTLNSIGLNLQHSGDYSGAEQRFSRARRILEAKMPEGNSKAIEVLSNLSENHRKIGNFSSALELANRVDTLSAKYVPGSYRGVIGRGLALWSMGKFAEAKAEFLGLRDKLEQAKRRDREALFVHQALAEITLSERDYTAAQVHSRRTVSMLSDAFGADHPFLHDGWSMVAEAEAGLNRRDAALEAAFEAERVRREYRRAKTGGLTEREALLEMAHLRARAVDTLCLLAPSLPVNSAELRRVWDAVIGTRALVLDQVAERNQSLSRSNDPAVARQSALVEDSRARLARVALEGPGRSTPAAHRARLEQLRAAADKAERELAALSQQFLRESAQRDSGLAEAEAALPRNTSLLGYYRAGEAYVAFALQAKGGAVRAVRLGSAARIDSLVAAWRAEVDREMNSGGRQVKANEARYVEAASALRRAIWDPIASGLAANAFIVPDGSLHTVNFAALPLADKRYLAETGSQHILTAERDLAGAALPNTPGKGTLALANPDSPPAFCGLGPWPALPGAAAEAAVTGAKPLFIGTAATEAAFKKNASGKRVLHLAAHGFFLARPCQPGAKLEENALLRSGIALTAGGGEDGILTASEVAGLNLASAEWVVLSGCDTGLGSIVAGEGVLGLRRAFHAAGARTVIASLWPVEDDETRAWMTALYRAHFTQKLPTAQAVRAATLERLRARRASGASVHPFHWAGFVAAGAWQ